LRSPSCSRVKFPGHLHKQAAQPPSLFSFPLSVFTTAAQLGRSLLPPLSCLWLKQPHHRVRLAPAHLLGGIHQPILPEAPARPSLFSSPVNRDHCAASRGQPPPLSLRAAWLPRCTRGELLPLPMPSI
jgi:hypothetical protein